MTNKLPIGWKLDKLSALVDVRDGTHDTPSYTESGYPLITSKNLLETGLDFNDVKLISKIDFDQINKRSKVDKGDILFAMIGTIGNPTIVDCDKSFAIKNVALFKMNNSKLITKYLMYVLGSETLTKQIKIATQGGIQGFISLDYLRKLLVPYPENKHLQEKVVNEIEITINQTNKMRDAAQKQNDAITAFQDSILREFFPYKKGGKLPKEWQWKILGGRNGIAEVINGATPSTDEPTYWDGDILWATPTDIGRLNSMFISDTERKITEIGYKSCSTTLVPVNSILMTSRAPVGNIAINTKAICTNQGFKAIVPKKGTDFYYLYFYLLSIVTQIQKDSHGNTFTEISKEKVEHYEIPMPISFQEQKKISDAILHRMKSVTDMIGSTKIQSDAVEALPSAILRQTFAFN